MQHHGSSGYDGSVADDRAVEHCRPHADECAVAHRAGMYSSIVSDGDIVADGASPFSVGYMDAGTVLQVGAVAKRDAVDVGAYDGAKPD